MFALLERSDSNRFWIHAPAGSGKTTLAASFAESRSLPGLWYQIDSRDSDPSSFFHYFGEAARNLAPRHRLPLLHLTPEYRLNIPLFILRYFEQIFGFLPSDSCIVIDNYQDLPPESILHDAIRLLLEHFPLQFKIIVISREEPPPLFARLLANSALIKIGWQQLRLECDETVLLARHKSATHLSDESIRQLQHVTDGWTAGVILLLEHARRGGADFSVHFNQGRQEIFDYFASQVISSIDTESEWFLLSTSIVSRFSVAMALEISCFDGARKLLANLCRGNFFITRHQSVQTWYQYHPLFREFLIDRAETNLSAETLHELRHRAAASADQAGLTDDAVKLFTTISDWDALAELLNGAAERLISQGRQETVLAWLAAIPQTVIESSGCFLFWKAASLSALDPFGARCVFESATRHFLLQRDRTMTLLSLSSTIDMCFIVFEFTLFDDLIIRVGQLLNENDSFPSADIEYRVTMSLFNALSIRRPDHPDIQQWRDRTMLQLRIRTDINLNQRVHNFVTLIADSLWMGDISVATMLVTQLKELLRRKELSELHRTMAINMIAIYALIAEREAVSEYVDGGIEFSVKTGINFLNGHLICPAVVDALHSGDIVKADGYLHQMDGALTSPLRFNGALYSLATAFRCLVAGDLTMALLHQTEALRLLRGIGWANIEPFFVLGIAIILNARGDVDGAMESLYEASAQSRRNGSKLNGTMCLLVEAEIMFGQKREKEGLAALARALPLWREMGNDNVVWWRNPVMADLFGRALDADIEVDFVQQLIRTRKLTPPDPVAAPKNWPWQVRIITLGAFLIERDGIPLSFAGKVQKKPLELLKVLISCGGKNVDQGLLSNILWADSDGDKSQSAFATALFRLRQLLGYEKALIVKNGLISLNARIVWVDVWAFENLEQKARAAWDDPHQSDTAFTLTQQALSHYSGEFLPGDHDKPWSFSMRERLKSKFNFKMEHLCSYWESKGDAQKAIRCYHDALEVDSLSEEFYQQLMLCYHRAGRRAEAINVYERCRKTLAFRLNITPSPLTEEIQNLIKNSI